MNTKAIKSPRGAAAIGLRKHRKGLYTNLCRYWQLYLFLLLPILYLLVFKYTPILGLQIAFKKYSIAGGIWGSKWIGLNNFQRFFTSYQFRRVLPNTILLSFYQLLASFPLPIILALCFNAMRVKRYKKFAQTLTYIPHFISTVVLVGMLFQLFNARVGLYGTLYYWFHGVYPAKDLLASPTAFRHMYVWSGIWQNAGWGTIIYVASLTSVDVELHEAAEIDGASRFKRLIHIDFPAIVPTISIMLILNAGNMMNIGFEKVYLMQNDLNRSASEVISTYVYNVGLAAGGGDFSYATAIGLFNSAVNCLLIVIVNAVSKRAGESSLW